MYQILNKEVLNESVVRFDVLAERVARAAQPGQFVIVKTDERGERIPLTICDYDAKAGAVSIVIQAVGLSTKRMARLNKGDAFMDFAGPLGKPSELVDEPLEELKKQKLIFIAGGVGAAPVYPQVKWLYERGIKCDVIIGARTGGLLIMENEMAAVCGNLYICTDDGSRGFNGNVTALLKDLVNNRGIKYDRAVAIGPMIMMKYACLATKELNIPTIVSMNPIMVDGTGMCGACRVSVGGEVKFACVDGPEFDGHLIDFDEALRRLTLYKSQEGREELERTTPEPRHAPSCTCRETTDEGNSHGAAHAGATAKTPVREQDPLIRATNFDEVCLGYTREEAIREAERCVNCKKPKCVEYCPVSIDIPSFISEIKKGNIKEAAGIIAKDSSLPAICGRVCPQETQCESVCVRGIKGESVAIGRLERFVGDYALKQNVEGDTSASADMSENNKKAPNNGRKVAIIGAGPAGLACAGDLAKLGYSVKIFEALHKPGGVLVYGIPEFRLPKKDVVEKEIENIKRLGVEIETNTVIGRTVTIEKLMEDEGFNAVFIGSGAGLPKFMGIPGENLNGVFSANEYLTRSNLMQAFTEGYDTPVSTGKCVAVIGGGNVAMDAARTALRLGAKVHIVYRRGESELPARLEEVHHAREEGIVFDLLTNPVEILSDENGWVSGMRCVKMALGEPDSSGRRSPRPIPGSEFVLETDMVIMALGTSPNPLLATTTDGLQMNRWNCLLINEETGETTRKGVFAGGDAVTGAATVILAMGAGRKAAAGMHKYLSNL